MSYLENLFGVAGKTAVVTGAATGIGRMMAEALVRAGARVLIASRKGADCARVAGELTAIGPGSAEGFAGQGDADNLYNLGNALARLGEFESAIGAYEEVLDIDPNNEDARYNLELLRQAHDQQQSESGQGQNQDSSSQSGGEGQQSEGEGDQNQSGAEGKAGSESQSGDSAGREGEMNQDDLEAIQAELERAAQEAAQQQGEADEGEGTGQEDVFAGRRAQEQRQAMEQWLRRIPNDPGGLLRRKFRYQYQRMGKDQDGNNLWPDDEVQPW